MLVAGLCRFGRQYLLNTHAQLVAHDHQLPRGEPNAVQEQLDGLTDPGQIRMCRQELDGLEN